MIAAAGVEQTVIRIARLRRRVELDRAHRVSEVVDDVRLTKQLAPRARERVGRRVGRVPFRDDVVVRHIGRREPGRNEVGRLRVAWSALGMHRVEQAVRRELRMKGEADEAALQPVVDSERKGGPDVRIHGGLVVAIDEVQQAARVVGEAAAVRQIAHEADARPAGRHHVLIGRTQAARLRQAHDVPDLDRQPAFRDRRRNRITGDRPPLCA